MDKYAQADGRFVGKPGTPTGSPSRDRPLKGAHQLVLGAVDHRETAFHPRAFREIYKFIAGREPNLIAIRRKRRSTLRSRDRHAGWHSDNRPVPGARWRCIRVSPYIRRTHGGACTRRGPLPMAAGVRPPSIRPGTSRSCSRLPVRPPPISTVRRFRAPPMSCICAAAPAGACRCGGRRGYPDVAAAGYFGLPRDVGAVRWQGAADVKPGVPTDSAQHIAAFGHGAARP